MRRSMRTAKKEINTIFRQTKNQPTTKEQRAARKVANDALFLIGATAVAKHGEIESNVTGAADDLKKAFEPKKEEN